MAKYNTFQKHKEIQRNQMHPVWRGIGFIIMLLTPIISYAATMLTLDLGKSQNWPFMAGLAGRITFPAIAYQLPYISIAARYVSSIPYLGAIILFFLAYLILFSGVFAFINAILYRIVGPPRYTDLDEPAPRVIAKKRLR